MNEKILKQNENIQRKHWKKTGKSTCCFLLILALLLGGCSSPASTEKNAPSTKEPTPATTEESTPTITETPEDDSPEPEGQTSEDTESEEDFDFNQPLALKTPEPAAGESPRILFVGNSHTYTNDLPILFSEVAAAMGHPSDVQELTEGMYTLTQFADDTDELGAIVNQKLTEESWDFVILQENTNDAFSFPEENMLPAAASLDEKIRAAGGQTALLMTWTPKEGAGIMGPEFVQSILAQNTISVSEQLNSLLIPGGVAFMRCLEQYPQIELWDEDGMHPSLEGSYLAACIAYTVIFQESPVGCTYTAGLEAETAAHLQELAAGFLAG